MNMPNQNVKITFKDPTSVRNDAEVVQFLTELKKYPMAWAVYPKRVSPSIRANINKGQMAGVEAGEFEAACRNFDRRNKPVTCDLYIRYLGDNAKPEPKPKDRKGAVLDCGCWFHAMPGQKVGEETICQNHTPQRLSHVIKVNVGENAWKNL